MDKENKVKNEKGIKRVEKFWEEEVCPECNGSRYVSLPVRWEKGRR